VSKHPNVELLERAFAAFGRDPVVVGRAIADDAVWRVPGANAMAGEYRGREAIFGFLRRTGELTGGTYRTRLQYVVADDERAVAVYRATGERGGRTLDIEQALFCVVRGAQLAEVTAVPFDGAAFDAFWA
jgi:ketosteroid isomerase-like protein